MASKAVDLFAICLSQRSTAAGFSGKFIALHFLDSRQSVFQPLPLGAANTGGFFVGWHKHYRRLYLFCSLL